MNDINAQYKTYVHKSKIYFQAKCSLIIAANVNLSEFCKSKESITNIGKTVSPSHCACSAHVLVHVYQPNLYNVNSNVKGIKVIYNLKFSLLT